MTAQSSLLLCGDVTVDALDLAGALSVKAPGPAVLVSAARAQVLNGGHFLQALGSEPCEDEVAAMRGYRLLCREMLSVEADAAGPAMVFTGGPGLVPRAHFDPEDPPLPPSLLCAPFNIFTRHCT